MPKTMTLTVPLSVKEELKRRAKAEGKSLQRYMLEFLTHLAANPPPEVVERLRIEEAEMERRQRDGETPPPAPSVPRRRRRAPAPEEPA